MATRVGQRAPGDTAYAEFIRGVRAAARGKTVTKVVTETVTTKVPVHVPVEVPEPEPVAVPVGDPPVTPPAVETHGPPHAHAPVPSGRDSSLKPSGDTIRQWSRLGGLGAAGCALWILLTATSDPLLSALGMTAAVVGGPLLLGVVLVSVYRTGVWLTSRTPQSSPTAQKSASPPVSQPAVSEQPKLNEKTETRYETREVPKRVAKQVPMDPDWAQEKALDTVKRSGYEAQDAIVGLPLTFEVVRNGVGANAEVEVGELLERELPEPWQVAHDLDVYGKGWRTSARDVSANVDHLLSGPSGVIMVDTKSWSGNLVVRGKRLANSGGAKGSSKVRANAPAKMLYEAEAVDSGSGTTVVDRVVIAVASGTVAGGILEVPPPPRESDNPAIPMVAVEVPKLVEYLSGLEATRTTPMDLTRVIAFSERLGA